LLTVSCRGAVGMKHGWRQPSGGGDHGYSGWVRKAGWGGEWVTEEITIVVKLFLYSCHNNNKCFLVSEINHCKSNACICPLLNP
jgi:hypothetical protein